MPVAHPLRPLLPGEIRLVASGAKLGIIRDLGTLAKKARELFPARRTGFEEERREFFEHLPPRLHFRAIINERFATEASELPLEWNGMDELLRAFTMREFWNGGYIEIKFVPEQSARRRVRARFGNGTIEESGQ